MCRRLVAALFDLDRNCLSTCCSAPILVLANNDAPNGPACINLDLAISDSWEGWPKAEMDSEFGEVHPRNLSTDSIQQDHYRLESAGPSGQLLDSLHAAELEAVLPFVPCFMINDLTIDFKSEQGGGSEE